MHSADGSDQVPALEALYQGSPPADGAGLLSDELARQYGSQLELPDAGLYANFVQTIDGAVALPAVPNSNRLISGGSPADRFVMGLLRALADIVLIGTGTLHGSPRSLWNAAAAFAPAAEMYAGLRSALGMPEHPAVAVIAGRTAPLPEHPVLADGATILAPAARAAAIEERMPAATAVLGISGDPDRVDIAAAVAALHAAGHRRILSEAGPRLFGQLLETGLVDDVFLTVAPQLAGGAPDDRYNLVEGVTFLPGSPLPLHLETIHRFDSELFLRYRRVE